MYRIYRIFMVFFCLGFVACDVHGETWAEKLGYPRGARVVIMSARELGISWEMNTAAKKLITDGEVTSATAVVTGPWFQDIARWSKQHPQVDIGLSLALTNPYELLTWHLLTSDQRDTSLVDAQGNPWRNVVQLAVNATASDVKIELDAQIAAARRAGIEPTHLSGYYGTAFVRTDLASVVLGAARKYWIPATVVELTPELIDSFRRQGYPVENELIQLIADYPLPKLDDMRLAPTGNTYEEQFDLLSQTIRSLDPGLTEIVFRPAVDSEGMRLLAKDAQQRVWDAQLLSDERVKKIFVEQGIIRTDWREVMRRFEDVSPTESDEATAETAAEITDRLPSSIESIDDQP